MVKLSHIPCFILENLGEESSCYCSCYQAKVNSTPSLSLELEFDKNNSQLGIPMSVRFLGLSWSECVTMTSTLIHSITNTLESDPLCIPVYSCTVCTV